jgi:hypothetical protein
MPFVSVFSVSICCILATSLSKQFSLLRSTVTAAILSVQNRDITRSLVRVSEVKKSLVTLLTVVPAP